MANFAADFKKFVNKGNIFDLAIGIIIGTSFTAVVNSLANDIILPLISQLIQFDLTSGKVILKEAEVDEAGEIVKKAIELRYGQFLQALIFFLIVALSIYIAIKIVNHIKKAYIRHQIEYVKNLKEKHPEFFDEEDEFGTRLYERLKKDHPEYFKNEVAEKIEQEKPKETSEEISLRLLEEINNNLKKISSPKEEVQPIEVETISDEKKTL